MGNMLQLLIRHITLRTFALHIKQTIPCLIQPFATRPAKLPVFLITFLCRQNIVSLFIDRSCPAFDIAVNGIPYFGVGFIFFAANMIGIGYYQSIRRGQRATIITLLRGVVFMLIGFFVLPLVLGVPGIWLAVSLAELLTTLYIIGIYFKDRFMVHRL